MFVVFFFLQELDRIPPCNSGCPGTFSLFKAGLTLKDSPVSDFQLLESKVWLSNLIFKKKDFKTFII